MQFSALICFFAGLIMADNRGKYTNDAENSDGHAKEGKKSAQLVLQQFL